MTFDIKFFPKVNRVRWLCYCVQCLQLQQRRALTRTLLVSRVPATNVWAASARLLQTATPELPGASTEAPSADHSSSQKGSGRMLDHAAGVSVQCAPLLDVFHMFILSTSSVYPELLQS